MTNQEQIELSDADTAIELTPAQQREVKVRSLIKKYAAVSAGLGLIPIPGLDIATVSSAQYAMIRDIAELYGYETSKERIRVIASSLLGGSLPVALGAAGGGSLVKSIPFAGAIAGAILVPTLASAATIALGRVFTQHFEMGGTLLDIDAQKMREHFQAEFEAAKLK